MDPGATAGSQTPDIGFGHSWRLISLSRSCRERGESQACCPMLALGWIVVCWVHSLETLGHGDALISAMHDVRSRCQHASRVADTSTTETWTSTGYLVFHCGAPGVNSAGVSIFFRVPMSIPEDGESSWGSGTRPCGEEIDSRK